MGIGLALHRPSGGLRCGRSEILEERNRGLTPAHLRALCDSLNDERGTGGQSKLARFLDWHHSTVWRKLNSKSPITESGTLAILKAMEMAEGR